MILFGVVLVQFLSYTSTKLYQADSRRHKINLWVLFGVDLAAASVSFAQAYWYGTSQDRNFAALQLGIPLDACPPLLTGAAAFMVQLMLARRCSRLFIDKHKVRKFFLGVIYFFAALAFVASLIVTIFFALYAADVDFGTATVPAVFIANVVAGVWLWATAAVDTTISITLFLLTRRQVSGFNARTDHVLRRVGRLGLQTASYTSLLAIAGAVTAICFPQDAVWDINIFFAFSFPLPSLYTISLLVTLIERKRLKRFHNEAEAKSVNLEIASTGTNKNRTAIGQRRASRIGLRSCESRQGAGSEIAGLYVVQEVSVHVDADEDEFGLRPMKKLKTSEPETGEEVKEVIPPEKQV
ncbi:hypothetical protein T439DRAFT_99674 [Meredithblackwellia eburnea MCA 4105]